MKAVKKAKKEMCNNTNNNQWSHCQLCDGREHLPTCTTKKVKGRDCVCGGVDYEGEVRAEEQFKKIIQTTTKVMFFFSVLWLIGFVTGVILSVLFPVYFKKEVHSIDSISGSIPLANVYISNSPTLTVSRMSVEDQIRTTLRIEGLEHLSDTFIKVAFYESTMNPNARGYAGPYFGLYQIYTGTWNGYGCEGDIFNAIDNTSCAIKIYRAEGWSPWHVVSAGLVEL